MDPKGYAPFLVVHVLETLLPRGLYLGQIMLIYRRVEQDKDDCRYDATFVCILHATIRLATEITL